MNFFQAFSLLLLLLLASMVFNRVGAVAGAEVRAAEAVRMAAASTDEDEEEDEEEEAVNYRDRVREVQQWMNSRRGAERKQEQDAGTPPPAAPRLSEPHPDYLQDYGYDENSYGRLSRSVRTRLQDAPHRSYRHGYHRHSSGHRHWRGHVRSRGHKYAHHRGHRRHSARHSAGPRHHYSRHRRPHHAVGHSHHAERSVHQSTQKAHRGAKGSHTRGAVKSKTIRHARPGSKGRGRSRH